MGSTRAELSANLPENRKTLEEAFHLPTNADLKLRSFQAGGRAALLCYLDGMCDTIRIEDFILRAAADAPPFPDSGDVLAAFVQNDLAVTDFKLYRYFDELSADILSGKCAVFIDGCATAAAIDMRKYDKRPVSRTISENVVLGPQEGFTESLRTNITLLRRFLRSEDLVCEMLNLGTQLPTGFAITYLKGTVNEAALDELRRRMLALDCPYVSGTGALQQQIEDHPYALFPQMLQTERPDRTASCLTEGQIAILSENSPYALIAPVTVFHLIHSSDDSFMRWQYGCFIRIIRFLGIIVSLYLPALYAAISMYHTHILPTSLFTSIAETRASVPFPVLVEVFIMELSFFLINEAGTRIPSQIGSALGIVGALILGQAAVAASIISPIMVIIVALTGLGNYTIPNYSMGIGIQIIRLMLVIAAAALGLYGVVLLSSLIFAWLGGMRSFGQLFFSPAAPWKPNKNDLIFRLPIHFPKRRQRKERP
ncbi:MAG: spore germination protein [Eubacteriales bacterium]|nr:spore germination protein [Eubacteriales bacterium]